MPNEKGEIKAAPWFSVKVKQATGAPKEVTILYPGSVAALLPTKVFDKAASTMAIGSQAATDSFAKALVKPQEIDMLLLAWRPVVMSRHARLPYTPGAENVADLPARPGRMNFQARSSLLPLATKVKDKHAQRLRKRSFRKIDKAPKHHAPSMAHLLPQFGIFQ